MAQSEAEWLEQHAQRLLVVQKAEADRAKLLATFAAGIAATLVATALQVGEANPLDWWAVITLGLCVLAVFGVVLFDRLKVPDHGKVLYNKTVCGWSNEKGLSELRAEELSTVNFNKGILNQIKCALLIQSVLAVTAGTLASVSLLIERVG